MVPQRILCYEYRNIESVGVSTCDGVARSHDLGDLETPGGSDPLGMGVGTPLRVILAQKHHFGARITLKGVLKGESGPKMTKKGQNHPKGGSRTGSGGPEPLGIRPHPERSDPIGMGVGTPKSPKMGHFWDPFLEGSGPVP